MKKPVVLTIMDGFGINPEVKGNAIKAAKTPRLDKIFAEWPTTQIGASGMDVGLPDGPMGNRSRSHQYRRGQNCLSGADPHYKVD